jgi:hypothetical protein
LGYDLHCLTEMDICLTSVCLDHHRVAMYLYDRNSSTIITPS